MNFVISAPTISAPEPNTVYLMRKDIGTAPFSLGKVTDQGKTGQQVSNYTDDPLDQPVDHLLL